MDTTLEQWTQELTDWCTCEDYDENTDTYSPSSSCYGCYEDALEGACDLVAHWLETQGLEYYESVKVQGVRLGWRNLSGYKVVEAEPIEIVKALYIDSDFNLTFTLSPTNELTAVRTSHDELGAMFEFSRVAVCQGSQCMETEGLVMTADGYPECEFCADIRTVN